MTRQRSRSSHRPAGTPLRLVLPVALMFLAWQTSGCAHETPKRKTTPPAASSAPATEKKPSKKPDAATGSPKDSPKDAAEEPSQLPPTPARPPIFGGSGG